MKNLPTIVLFLLFGLKTYGQDIYTNYQQQRQQISNAQNAALKVTFNIWATENPLTPDHAYSACDGWPGAGYKCRAHNLQCCSKGCAEAFTKQKNSTEKDYQVKLDQADADYTQKNAAATKAKEAEQAQSDKSKEKDLQAPATKNKPNPTENIKKSPEVNTQYKQQSDSYLNKALYGSSNGVNQQYNFANAGINAAMAGDKTKVQQIQQQSNQAFQNNLTSTLNNLTAMIQENANKKAAYANEAASIRVFYDRKEIRTRLYNAIQFYSKYFVSKDYQFWTRLDPFGEQEMDDLNIFDNSAYLSDINKLLAEKNGISLDSNYLFPSWQSPNNLFSNPFEIEHKNAFGYQFMDAYKGYDFSGPVLKGQLIDDRSKKEKTHLIPNDLREVLPKLTAAYYANDLNQFDSFFEIYKNSAEIKKDGQFYSNAFLQWLYQAKARLLFEQATTEKNKAKFIDAFNQLVIADTVATINDYDSKNAKFHYNIDYLLNTPTYWDNLSLIRQWQFGILQKIYALPETGDQEKGRINQAILNIYYKTKNDMAPIFSDPTLHSVSIKINDKSK